MLKIVKNLSEGLMLLDVDTAVQAKSGFVNPDAKPVDQGIKILREIAKRNIHPVAYLAVGKSVTPLYDSRDLMVPAENLEKAKKIYKVVKKVPSESLLIDSKTAIKTGSTFINEDDSSLEQGIAMDTFIRTKHIAPYVYEGAGKSTTALYDTPDIGVDTDNVG